MKNTKPNVGDRIEVYGEMSTIIRVYAFGTCDVETDGGRYFRVTGLGWI